MTFDVTTLREQFPLISGSNKDFVYLDNAATTQKPRAVLDAVMAYYENTNANVHRAAHALSDAATRAFEAARGKVAEHINAASAREIIWTRGTTEAINLVANAYGGLVLGPDDQVLITELEHHSNIVPWQIICTRTGAKLVAVRVTDGGSLDLNDFETKLCGKTKIVALGHVSNALGTINPVKDLIALAHAAGAITIVDGAQAMAHFQVDVRDLDCDFYAFSGHKMYAPTGIGVLYGREPLLEMMPPWQSGGEMIEEVHIDKSTYARPPFKFEAGTPHIAGAIGLGAAIDFLRTLDPPSIAIHENDLLNAATSGLQQIDSVRIVGTAPAKGPVISFLMDNAHPHDVGTLLDQQGIAVRTGHHCAMPLMKRLGIPGTIRASLSLYNSQADVDKLIAGVHKARSFI
jgi:SufS family cysteine desulfurase